MEQLVGFANKEIAYLKVEVVKVIQRQNASGTKVEELTLDVQFVSGLAEEVKKFHELVSTLKTIAFAKVFRGSKSPAANSKLKNAEVESKRKKSFKDLDF